MEFYYWAMICAAFGMSLGSVGAAISQGLAVKSAVEGIARNPGASGKILTTMMVGLALIESLAIYVFVVAMIVLLANPFADSVFQLLSK